MNWIEWLAFGAVVLWVVGVLNNIQGRLAYINLKIDRLVHEQFDHRGEGIDADTMLQSLVSGTPYAEIRENKKDMREEWEATYREYLHTVRTSD